MALAESAHGRLHMRQPTPFGKYVLLERISVGGMAEVFKAKSFGVEGFEKILAIKRILPSLAEDSDFIEMFIDEAKICGQLNHANICQIFELGRVQDSHFIAMEFVWGKDLLQLQNRLRKQRSTMKPEMAAFIACKLCEGLDYAHKKKDPTGKPLAIIHRDISPQNILVSYEGELKIIDFGIAKAASRSSKTQAGVLKGKFGYMSPEQVRGLPLDRRSDIFAIGTILYELLVADRVFIGESDFETLEKVRNVDIPKPTQANASIPMALEKIIMRALTKDVDDRYQWAHEMQEELQSYLSTLDPVFTGKQLAAWMRDNFAPEMKREQDILDEQRKIGREVLTAQVAQSFGAQAKAVSAAPVPEVAPLPANNTRVVDDSDLMPADDDEGFAEKTTVTAPDFGVMLGQANAAAAAAPVAAAAPTPAPLTEQKTAILDGAVHPIVPPPKVSGVVSVQNGSAATDMRSESTVILQDGSSSGPKGPPVPSAPNVVVQKVGAEAKTMMGGQAPVIIAPQTPPSGTVQGFVPNPGTGQVHAPLPYAPAVRSTLWKDILIGVLVAVALVGGALGVRAYFAKGPAKGTLVVMSPRAAEVLIDGTPRGKLEEGKPLTLKDVLAGAHAVVIRASDGSEFKQSVTLQAGDVSVMTATLAPPPSTVGSGTLRLNVMTAGAQVWVDGAQLADDAWKGPIPLRADVAHEIRVTKPQREEVKLTVTLKNGEELKKDIELLPGYGKIAVTTDPAGAEININGKRAGVSPVTVGDLDPGKPARVTIRAKGFAPVTKYVQFDKGLDQVLDIKMVAGDDAASTEHKPPVLADVSVDVKPEKPSKPAPKEKDPEELAPVKPAATTNANEPGFLVANTQPWAKVLIDGKDTGKTTPIAPRSKISLKPGKHIVTFVANGKKFNFDIVVKPGEDTRLIKQLTDSGP
jgi:eukaryotic-like serine/threonine-protein kinase